MTTDPTHVERTTATVGRSQFSGTVGTFDTSGPIRWAIHERVDRRTVPRAGSIATAGLLFQMTPLDLRWSVLAQNLPNLGGFAVPTYSLSVDRLARPLSRPGNGGREPLGDGATEDLDRCSVGVRNRRRESHFITGL